MCDVLNVTTYRYNYTYKVHSLLYSSRELIQAIQRLP